MPVNPYNHTSYGYTGLFRQPYANQSMYGDTLYCITSENHQIIHMLVLSDGFFKDAYRILSQPTYQMIHIYVPSAGMLFISDLFRLVTSLKTYKRDVFWHYPTITPAENPENVLFNMAQLCGNTFRDSTIPNLTVQMFDSESTAATGWYDFGLINGKRKEYFSLVMTESKWDMVCKSGYDLVHLPYNTYYLPSITAIELYCKDEKNGRKIVPNNFRNVADFKDAAMKKYALCERLM